MKNRVYIILSVALLISGCVPIPNNEYFAPKITGILNINGSPAVNTKIYLGSAVKLTSCASNPVITFTNQKGEFEIGPIKEFKFSTTLYGDPAAIWELCAEQNGEIIKFLYQDGHFSPDYIHVKCDLGKTIEHNFTNTNRGVFGKCDL